MTQPASAHDGAAPAGRGRLPPLACRLPVFAAPMFLVSGPEMVVAACKAGIVGAFPTPNVRAIEVLG